VGISSWLLGTGALLIQAGPLDASEPQFPVIPQPAAVRRLSGTFTLDQHNRLLASDPESRRVAELFNGRPADSN
jgi:hypothetical protein